MRCYPRSEAPRGAQDQPRARTRRHRGVPGAAEHHRTQHGAMPKTHCVARFPKDALGAPHAPRTT